MRTKRSGGGCLESHERVRKDRRPWCDKNTKTHIASMIGDPVETETDHCPNCGMHVDGHVPEVMQRNRAARETHFPEITAQFEQSSRSDARWLCQFELCGAMAVVVLLIVWQMILTAKVQHLEVVQ